MKILTSKKEDTLIHRVARIQVENLSVSYDIEALLKYMVVPESKKDSVESILRDIRYYMEDIDSTTSAILRGA